MRNAAGSEHGIAGFSANLPVTDLKNVLALDDVPPLVLIVMNMEGHAAWNLVFAVAPKIASAPFVSLPDSLQGLIVFARRRSSPAGTTTACLPACAFAMRVLLSRARTAANDVSMDRRSIESFASLLV